MKNKILLFVIIGLIAGGAVCMSYGTDTVIDVIGVSAMAVGAAIATVLIVKGKDGTKKWIASLVCIWLGVVILAIAGFIHFSLSIILAILGGLCVAAACFIELKR